MVGMDDKPDIRALGTAELTKLLGELGERAFRVQQLRRWLWTAGAESFAAMHNLSRGLRAELERRYSTALPRVIDEARSADGTLKLLLEYPDGARTECVSMPRGGEDGTTYRTACLSTMSGCPLGCAFCATAQLGLTRKLAGHEIAAQVLLLRKREAAVRNVVLMGQGEPLLNYSATLKALRLLLGPLELGARRITVSTAGVPAGIRRLAAEALKVKLAVSLNAPTDELRDELMPINRRFPLAELLAACREYYDATDRRITFEYVLLGGVNDGPTQAQALVKKLHGIPHKLNLIVYNPVPGLPFEPPPAAAVERFLEITRRGAYAANLRRSQGADIAAACGQLMREKSLDDP